MALPLNPDDPGGDGGGGGGTVPGNNEPINTSQLGTVIFDENFVKQDADSVLRIMCYASLFNPDDLIFLAYVVVDGVVKQSSTTNLVFVGGNAQMPITLPAFISGLSAGAHNIKFSIRNREKDGTLQVLAGATIEISEIKRAAM
jgi:hypothetical protein